MCAGRQHSCVSSTSVDATEAVECLCVSNVAIFMAYAPPGDASPAPSTRRALSWARVLVDSIIAVVILT
jgi:hypothetical protein